MAVHTRAGEGVETDREGTRANHQYNLLGHIGANTSGVIVEPYLITLTEASDTFPTFQHGGIETIYMLEGAVDYRHGDEIYPLRPGDTLFFAAFERESGNELWKTDGTVEGTERVADINPGMADGIPRN